MRLSFRNPSALSLLALALLGPSSVQARFMRNSRPETLFDGLAHSDQLVLNGLPQKAASGCITYQLSFPETCCPSSYTRVKSARTHHLPKARDPSARRRKAQRAAEARNAKPTFAVDSARSSGHHGLLRRMLDADQDWERQVREGARDKTVREGAKSTATIPLAARPQPNSARDTYEPRPTATSDPTEDAPEKDELGCVVEVVYAQAACPFEEERALVESHQIEQLEMYRDLSGGRNVVVECGRVGTFFY